MKLTYTDGNLFCKWKWGERLIHASCDVRTLKDGRRKSTQVVYAMTENSYQKYAYEPRTFPIGEWNVGKPRSRDDPYRAPYYIPTDAEQFVDVWELNEDGEYFRPTKKQVLDLGYGLHFSTWDTTLGCIKIENYNDLCWLVEMIDKERELERGVTIRVIP